ncbi:hypothetical protein CLV62_104163 [Dysgonomonas alginatilytica]|uniref:Uncharacterized protein n=1 Tax=Dysgonomonas alginatilytica TaxID=1605892 RepID=A0A2V3PYN2_9BACT|nr:hypothetical protein [Dysgonomonas alginatilytica]PXV66902.1 hypothetical protein CLV62_104163 [Dysgonomonas alginatilytica]
MVFNIDEYPILGKIGQFPLDELISIPLNMCESDCDSFCSCQQDAYEAQNKIKREIGKFSIILEDNIEFPTESIEKLISELFLSSSGRVYPSVSRKINQIFKETKHGVIILGNYLVYYLIVSETEHYFLITTRSGILIMAAEFEEKENRLCMMSNKYTEDLAKDSNVDVMDFVHDIFTKALLFLYFKDSQHYGIINLVPHLEVSIEGYSYKNETSSDINLIF